MFSTQLAKMFSYFEQQIDPFPPKSPAQPPKGLYEFCRHYTLGLEKHLVLLGILTACTAVGEALLYAILGKIVDWLATSNPATFFLDQWPMLLGMSIFVLLFMPIAVTLQSLVVHQTLVANFPMSVRWLSHRYVLDQSYSFFQNEFSGRIATKVMQTALAVRETVMTLLEVMLFVTIYMLTSVILVASADLRLTLPVLVWLVVYIFLLRYFLPRLKSISTRQADARSMMTGRIVDSYSNIMTLKLFSHSRRESNYVKEGMSEFLETVHPQMRLVTLLNSALWVINMLLVFVTGGLGIYLWTHSAISPGAIAIAMSLAIRLTGMSHWIMWEVGKLFENIGTVQDGINTIALPHTIKDNEGAEALQVSKGEIIFEQVDFTYDTQSNKGEKVFNRLDLNIGSGEKVGIVGRSGAGKSSLVNLLLRFYDIQAGKITIDGQNICAVNQDSLRAHIGVVTQDTSLLHRSVRENILFGRPNADEAQMLSATRAAQAHEFIQTLSDDDGKHGYDAKVGERGVKLSGGQRQRVAIARVLLKDAPILILDEATSALDSEVEAGIQENLYKLMSGKTVIAIAHRLSTIAAMDRLIVLDEGKIIEQGSHKELLAQNGVYANLWAHQSGGFLGED